MFCRKCGKEIADDSLFCPACGQSTATEPVQVVVKAEEKPKKERKPVNKKAIKLTAFISGGAVLATAIVLAVIFVFVPMAKYNAALALMDEGKYEEALEKFQGMTDYIFYNSSVEYECCEKAIEQLVDNENYERAFELAIYNDMYDLREQLALDTVNYFITTCQAEKAMQFCYDNAWYDSYDYLNISDKLPSQIDKKDREKLYTSIVNVMNGKEFVKKGKEGCSASVLSYMLSALPNDYKDAGKLKLFCDDIMDNFGDHYEKYIHKNRDLIESLWKYKSVRQFAIDEIDAFLCGVWETADGSTYLSFEYNNDNTHTYACQNLSVPQVAHRYYDIVGMTMIYCNEGDSKVCDVFKFEFSETDPNQLTVYCYEDGKTVILNRN